MLYVVHDTEDFINIGIFSIEQLVNSHVPILSEICQSMSAVAKSKDIARMLFNLLLESFKQQIRSTTVNGIALTDFIKNARLNNKIILCDQKILGFEPDIEARFKKFLEWMYENIYASELVRKADEKAIRTINGFFHYMLATDLDKAVIPVDIQRERIRLFNQDRLALDLKDEQSIIQAIIDLLSTTSEEYLKRFLRQHVSY